MHVSVIIIHVVSRPLYLRIRASDHIPNTSCAGNNEFLISCIVSIDDELLENPG